MSERTVSLEKRDSSSERLALILPAEGHEPRTQQSRATAYAQA